MRKVLSFFFWTLALSVLFCDWCTYEESRSLNNWLPLPFDYKLWNTPRELQSHPTWFPLIYEDVWVTYEDYDGPPRPINIYDPTRFRMLQSMLSQLERSDRTRTDVLKLIGKPDYSSESKNGDEGFSYLLRAPNGWGSLNLDFEDEKLVKAKVTIEPDVESD